MENKYCEDYLWLDKKTCIGYKLKGTKLAIIKSSDYSVPYLKK